MPSLDTFQEYLNRPLRERLSYYQKDGRILGIMVSQQFSLDFLQTIFELTDQVREMTKTQEGSKFLTTLLYSKRGMLYFTQPSTRTFLSFTNAMQMVGMMVSEVRDPNLSSEIKGETIEDGLRVMGKYSDVMVMRTPQPGLSEYIAYLMKQWGENIVVINGGSGQDQHPTQALLDAYTIHQSFKEMGGVSGKKYCFVGDLWRGRAARSIIYLLSQFEEIEMFMVAPEKFQIEPDLEDHLKKLKIPVHKTTSLKEVLPTSDCVYMTRVQDEYDQFSESKEFDDSEFHLTPERVALMKQESIIMHPLPRRQEIDPAIDFDPRAKYWEQVSNGMYVRAALLLYLFQQEKRLQAFSPQ